MKTLFSAPLSSLQTDHYLRIPLNLDDDLIPNAVEAFFAFLALDDELKQHINFTIAPKHRRGDIGYRRREASDGIYNDNKEFFHFHPAVFEKYPVFIQQHTVIQDFFSQAELLWHFAHDAIHKILQQFTVTNRSIIDKVFDCRYPHILLRFLKYEWQQSGRYLAKPHYDAGACTLAIAESCAGLRIGSLPENLVSVEHCDDSAIFMLSSNFNKLISDEGYSAAWHDVIQLDESKIGQAYARWALVAFVDAHDVTALPREETHKWYTDPTHVSSS